MPKKAIVLVNIGTPEELSVKGVRKYLRKFLMDKNVIDIPFLARLLLVRGLIVPFRAPKSLEAYRAIWKEKGSPLNIYTEEIIEELSKKYEDEYLVRYAMSYSHPYIDKTLDELKSEGVKEILYIPMYPQYAQSSSLSALEDAEKWLKKNQDVKVKTTSYYFDHPDFLKASVDKIKDYVSDDAKMLYSFHGIPEKQVTKIHKECSNCNKCCTVWHGTNEFCYRSQCFKTASDLSNKLGLSDWEVSFQSRLGRAQWILPYTVEKVRELAKNGVKKLVVAPYAFTVDCLETEEEIEFEIREAFVEAGGEGIVRVPCLNRDFYKVVTGQFLSDLRPLASVLSEVRAAN
ncbi:MAG: ferrochelatase [Bdellovibrionales bacterium]